MPIFPKYESYKDSGVEWLGKIPSHWDFRRLKHIAKVRLSNVDKHSRTNELPVKLCNYTDVYYKDFITNAMAFMEATATEEQISNFALEEGDVLITKDSESFDDIAVPAYVPEALKNVVCGYHLAHIKPVHIEGSYLFRAFQAEDIASQFRVSANGITRFGIGKSVINDAIFLLPPVEEQNRIVEFLDRTTTEIDRAISQKQHLIELLQEQKAILINQAVTKGLNPNVPMRDSGIEWIGEIPKHWDLKRLGWITSVINDIDHKMPNAVANGIPFLSAKDLLDDGTLNFTEDIKLISKKDFERLARKVQPRRNDIVYSRIGARLGKARLVKTDIQFQVSYSCCVIRVKKEIAFPEYVASILDSDFVLTEAKLRTVGVGVPDLGLKEISRFLIPLPPLEEQERLSQFLHLLNSEFKSVLDKEQEGIALLRELQQCLISNAVTGKIKV